MSPKPTRLILTWPSLVAVTLIGLGVAVSPGAQAPVAGPANERGIWWVVSWALLSFGRRRRRRHVLVL